MENVSKYIIQRAYDEGYRVANDGSIISPEGKVKKTRVGKDNYMLVTIGIDGHRSPIMVHRLAAYQKFGEIMFAADCIRHLDGNSLNNSFDNLEIGTNSDNRLDIKEDVRRRTATIASHSNPKYRDNEFVKSVREYHKKERSYKKTMEKFGISSKGTLYHMLNVRNIQ